MSESESKTIDENTGPKEYIFTCNQAYYDNINFNIKNKSEKISMSVLYDRIFFDLLMPEGANKVNVKLKLEKPALCKMSMGIWKKSQKVNYKVENKEFNSDVLDFGDIQISHNEERTLLFFELKSRHTIKATNLILKSESEITIDKVESNKDLRERRHADASYCISYIPTLNGKWFYRELKFTDYEPNTYCTFAFSGGYIGLAPKKNNTDFQKGKIVFSVWDSPEGKPICTNKHKNTFVKRFTHEGNGTHTSYQYVIREKVSYGLLLNIKYVQDSRGKNCTDYSAYVIDVSKQEPVLYIATIRRPGKHYPGQAYLSGKPYTRLGSFIENPSSANGHLYHRRYMVGNDWVYDGNKWYSAHKLVYQNKDSTNSNAKRVNSFLHIGIGAFRGVKNGKLVNNQEVIIKNKRIPRILKKFVEEQN
jgi:hypothetical protein